MGRRRDRPRSRRSGTASRRPMLPCSPGSRAAAAARRRRAAELPPADAGPAAGRGRPRGARPARLSRRMEMGRHPRPARRARRREAALFALRRRYRPRPFPTSWRECRTVSRSTASCWCCATARSRRSTICSSGSTARPPTRQMLRDYPGCGPALRPAARGRRGSARRCRSIERRQRLDDLVSATRRAPRLDLSPLVPFDSWDELRGAARRRPRARHRGADAEARATRPMSPAGRRGRGSSGSAARSPSTPC